jgi:predicted nucleic acid-binding protein
VLDTSFWVAGYRAEIVANCLDLFTIVVPTSVEAEIRSIQATAPHREYPYATLFRHLRTHMADPPVAVISPLSRFGHGEAEAIPLALHLNAALLINEHRAARYASSLNVNVVTVPAVIVALLDQDLISKRAAQRKLQVIESITASHLIDGALAVIREM